MGALKHYTPSRFARLIATQARLKAEWWQHRLEDSGHNRSEEFYQRRREDVIKVLESELNDMAFYGLYIKEDYEAFR